MNQSNFTKKETIFDIVSLFEEMSQTEAVQFPTEESYYKLIDYFEVECQFNRALEVAEYALTQHPYSAGFHLRKAQLLLDSQHEELAMAALDEAEIHSPGNREISLLRSEILSSLELYDDALAILEDLKQEAVDSREMSNIYLYESLVYENMKSHERRFYTLKAALLENPDNQVALKKMWFCTEISKKFDESVALHEKILEDHPFSALAWRNLGAAHAYFCDYEKAIVAYEYAFLIDENFEFAYMDCAEMCFEMQKYRKALQCYQDVLERFEPDYYIFQRIGQCYQNLGNCVIAKTFFEKAIQLDNFNDEAFFHLAKCYSQEENWKKAIYFYVKAVRINDKQEEYFSGLASAYYQLGEYDKAGPFFKEAAEIAPELSQYWIQYASFLMEMDQKEKALQILDEAEEYAVGTELLYCRVACLFALGERKEALFLLGDALDEDFSMHDSLFQLLPKLEEDTDIQAIIATYQPYC